MICVSRASKSTYPSSFHLQFSPASLTLYPALPGLYCTQCREDCWPSIIQVASGITFLMIRTLVHRKWISYTWHSTWYLPISLMSLIFCLYDCKTRQVSAAKSHPYAYIFNCQLLIFYVCLCVCVCVHARGLPDHADQVRCLLTPSNSKFFWTLKHTI